MIRVAVIGAGAFGREHARVYSGVSGSHLAAVCDIDEQQGRPVPEHYGADFVTDYRELLGRVDAISLTVPTESHHAIACEPRSGDRGDGGKSRSLARLTRPINIEAAKAAGRWCRLAISNVSTLR
jgi:hypothetical protein